MGLLKKALSRIGHVAVQPLRLATVPIRTIAHAVAPNRVAGTILNKSVSRNANPTVTRSVSAPINLGTVQKPILTNIKTAIDQRQVDRDRQSDIMKSKRYDTPPILRSPIESFTDVVLPPAFQPEAPNTLAPEPSFISGGLADLNLSQQNSDIQNPNTPKMLDQIKSLPKPVLYVVGGLILLLGYMFFKKRRR